MSQTVFWSTSVNLAYLRKISQPLNFKHQRRFLLDYRKCHAHFSELFALRFSPVRRTVGTLRGLDIRRVLDRIGPGLKKSGQGLANCFWSSLVNFGLLVGTFAAPQLNTSARVPVHLPQVPRPPYGLGRADSSSHGWLFSAASPRRYSITTRTILLRFEATVSGTDSAHGVLRVYIQRLLSSTFATIPKDRKNIFFFGEYLESGSQDLV
jgi:hypothetical protein